MASLFGSTWDDPQTIGLLSAASALMQAGGPSRVPVGFGQALGGAIGSGLQGYQGQQQFNIEKKSKEMQQAMAELQLNEARKKLADQEAARQALMSFYQGNGMPQSAPQNSSPMAGTPAPTASTGTPAASSMPTASTGVTPKAEVWKQYETIGNIMAARGLTDQAQQYYTLAEKYRPKYKADSQTVTMPDGSIRTVMTAEDGSQTVSPYTPAEKLVQQDTGGGTRFANPYTGLPVAGTNVTKTPTPDSLLTAQTTRRGQDMTDSRERMLQSPDFKRQQAAGTKLGENQATAITTLPQVVSTAQQGIQNIDALIGQRDEKGNLLPGSQPHPGFESSVGMRFPGLKYIPGTDTADFNARLDQVLGGGFMQAYQSLKGGGQITEVEGKKATDAITRMSTSQSEKEFVKAALEFRNVVQQGVQRAQMQAGQNPQAAAPASGGVKFLGFEGQ